MKVSRKLGNGQFGCISSPDIYLANNYQDSHFSTADAIWEFKHVEELPTGIVISAYRYKKIRPAYTLTTLKGEPGTKSGILEDKKFNVGLMGVYELDNVSQTCEPVPLENIRRKYVVNDFDGKFIGYPLIALS
jgi:adenine specific DNA methylase Mod